MLLGVDGEGRFFDIRHGVNIFDRIEEVEELRNQYFAGKLDPVEAVRRHFRHAAGLDAEPDREKPEADFLAREMLAAAAGADDEETFDKLLDLFSDVGFTRGLDNGIYRDDRIYPWLREIFISRDEKYLNKIYERFGIYREPYGNRLYYRGDGFIRLKMPEAYFSLLYGDRKMAEYFLKIEGFGSGEWRMEDDDLLFMRDPQMDNLHAISCLWGMDNHLREPFPVRVPDCMSAAMLSGRKDLAVFVNENLPDILFNDMNALILLNTSENQRVWFLNLEPEAASHISAYQILLSRSPVLLRRLMEKKNWMDSLFHPRGKICWPEYPLSRRLPGYGEQLKEFYPLLMSQVSLQEKSQESSQEKFQKNSQKKPLGSSQEKAPESSQEKPPESSQEKSPESSQKKSHGSSQAKPQTKSQKKPPESSQTNALERSSKVMNLARNLLLSDIMRQEKSLPEDTLAFLTDLFSRCRSADENYTRALNERVVPSTALLKKLTERGLLPVNTDVGSTEYLDLPQPAEDRLLAYIRPADSGPDACRFVERYVEEGNIRKLRRAIRNGFVNGENIGPLMQQARRNGAERAVMAELLRCSLGQKQEARSKWELEGDRKNGGIA